MTKTKRPKIVCNNCGNKFHGFTSCPPAQRGYGPKQPVAGDIQRVHLVEFCMDGRWAPIKNAPAFFDKAQAQLVCAKSGGPAIFRVGTYVRLDEPEGGVR